MNALRLDFTIPAKDPVHFTFKTISRIILSPTDPIFFSVRPTTDPQGVVRPWNRQS